MWKKAESIVLRGNGMLSVGCVFLPLGCPSWSDKAQSLKSEARKVKGRLRENLS